MEGVSMAGVNVEVDESVLLLRAEDEAAVDECQVPTPCPRDRLFRVSAFAGLSVGAALLATAALARCALGGGGSQVAAVSTPSLRRAISLSDASMAPNSYAPSVQKKSDDACLCLFDVDRTLTVKQGFAGACGPDSQEYPKVHDPAFDGGHLVLSPVGLHLEQTFCGQCHRGIISAGTAGGPDERSILSAHFGDYAWSSADKIQSPLVHGCADGTKHHCAKAIVDWMAGQGHFVEPDRVHFFDDHVGNTRGFEEEYGYNARLISCDTRDKNGLIGLCGAQLSEIVPDKGTWQCGV
jgi:hypothetical protein